MVFPVVGLAAVLGNEVVGAYPVLDGEGRVLHQADDLGAGQQRRSVAVQGRSAGRTVVVIHLVAGEGGAVAGAFDVAVVVELGGHAGPAGRRDRTVGGGADPAVVRGVGEDISEHGAGRGLQVGVAAVQHLVPQ